MPEGNAVVGAAPLARRQRVLVVQRRMTHYRLPFFEALREALARRGCELVLAHGEGTDEESSKNDSGELPWAERLRTRYLLSGKVCWQPFGSLLREADLVVLTAENKLVYNLWVQATWLRGRLALWGHGANLQGDPRSWREAFKRRVARRADWWLAYTSHSVPLIQANGFPAERISVLNNAIDTQALARQCAAVDDAQLQAVRARLGLADGPVGLYLGSLYQEKRIDMILQAAQQLREAVPGFQLVVAGAGPELPVVEAAARRQPGVFYAGAPRGQDKAALLKTADLLLNPGMVGLGILDSFVAGVPLVTTDCGFHSPEVAYLESGRNGLMTADDLGAFTQACLRLLSDRALHQQLSAGCLAAAARYTVQEMAERFADAAEACLAAPMLRRPAG